MAKVVEIKADTINKIEGMLPAENGQHIIVKARIEGEDRHLALPIESAIPAALNLFALDAICRQIASDQNLEATPLRLTVKDWNVSLSEVHRPIVDITTKAGISLSYEFSDEDLPELMDALFRVATVLGQVPPPGTKRQ